jgi:hypothetical protein
MDVGVEGEAVRAADEPHVVGAEKTEELRFAAPEAPVRMGCEVAVQVGRHVHQNHPVRLLRGCEAGLEEGEILFPGPFQSLGRSAARDLDLADHSRCGVMTTKRV